MTNMMRRAEVGPDPGRRSRLRQDFAFVFRTRIRTQSQKFVKNRTQIRHDFCISAVARVSVLVSYVKTWVNYGCFDDRSQRLNKSRILKFEKLLESDSKILEQERSRSLKK